MRRIIYITIILSLCFACANEDKNAKTSNQESSDDRLKISKIQFNKNKMLLGKPSIKSFPVAISVNGIIDVPPENRAEINTTMGGYIKTTKLLEGDEVIKGQTLVTIENPTFISMQQEYLEVKEQLDYLKAEYDRHKVMWNEKITSQKTYLKAESSYKTALASYNGLRKQLVMLNISPTNVENGNITSSITLYAPINGKITKVNVSRGTYVSPASTIMEIVDNTHIHLELSVFEKDIMKISKEQKIRFRIPEASNDVYDAEVHLVGSTLQSDRTTKVHGHPTDSTQNFLTGMFVEAEIITRQSESLAIPESAVVEVDEDHYILILDEENESDLIFRKVKVESGETFEGYVELVKNDAIQNSDKILIEGAFGLLGI